MEKTQNKIAAQTESENKEVAIDILRAFIDCALENGPVEFEKPVSDALIQLEIAMLNESKSRQAQIEIKGLINIIKSMKWDKEWDVSGFVKQSSADYFHIHYDNPKEADVKYQEFLKFGAKHCLCKIASL